MRLEIKIHSVCNNDQSRMRVSRDGERPGGRDGSRAWEER